MKRFLIFLTILMSSAFLLAGCALNETTPSESGEIMVVMEDYTFSTDVIRVQAGDTVTIVLSNEGDKLHEFMIGRDPVVEGNFTEGFSEGFFEGMVPDTIKIRGLAMIMGLAGVDAQGGMDMSADEGMPADDGMAGMDMGSDEEMPADDGMVGMDMGGDEEEGDGEHVEEEVDMGEYGPFQMPAAEAHAGLMVMIDPRMIPSGDTTTITFTVPEDKVGEWEIGCFQERGQHYDDGMRAKFIVEPSS